MLAYACKLREMNERIELKISMYSHVFRCVNILSGVSFCDTAYVENVDIFGRYCENTLWTLEIVNSQVYV